MTKEIQMTEKSSPEVSFPLMNHPVDRETFFFPFVQPTDVYTRAPITRPIVLMGPSGKKSQVRRKGEIPLALKINSKKIRRGGGRRVIRV